jgi:hypothetical protein
MSLLWSAQQHEWLAALGHRVYVQGAVMPEAGKGEVVAAVPPPVPVAAPPLRRRVEPAEPLREVPAAPPARLAARLPDKLHFALIRASGCNPSTAEAAAIMAQWPDSAELRGNPAAKRALWPSLRALRRPALP